MKENSNILRIPEGISMVDLAEESGVSKFTLYRIKDGKEVKMSTLEKVIDALERLVKKREQLESRMNVKS